MINRDAIDDEIDRMKASRSSLHIELFSSGPPNETIFFLGATRCGKTQLMGNLIKDAPRFVVIDIKDDYPATFFNAVIARNDTEFVSLLNQGKSRIIVKPGHLNDLVDLVDKVARRLMEFQRMNSKKLPPVAFVTDEFNLFVRINQFPAGIASLVTTGGGLNIKKYFGGQWFNHIPAFIRDSFSEIYVFRHCEPRGLAMLENYGFDQSVLQNLPSHTVCHLNGGEITTYNLVATKQKEI